jgi:hypothetical protein
MVVFVYTVVVGILNGVDAVEFGRRPLLAHLHVGTLGWITLSVFAATIWLFTGPQRSDWRDDLPRQLTPLAIVAIVGYGLAFLTTYGWARPALGALAALAIAGFFVWAVAQARDLVMSVPRWGILVALFTSVSGGVLGVLWGVLIASDGDVKTLPDGGQDAHPATMVVGFLIPAALALVEWWLRPRDVEVAASRGGFVQMLLLFLGGFTLAIGVLLDAVPLIMLNLPFSIAAIATFVVRNRASLRTVCFDRPDATPFLAAGSVAVVVNLGMLVYLISRYADDFDSAPRHLLLALDHLMFIGVMTNAIFGFFLAATFARRAIMPWADRTVYWLVNVGMAGFWWGFVLDEAWPKRLFTPLMGTGILLGLLVLFRRTFDEPIAAEPVGPARAEDPVPA